MSDRIIVVRKIPITHKEGTTGDIVINVPSAYSLSGKSLTFRVRNSYGEIVFEKSTTSGIVVVNQQIKIAMLTADTEGKTGTYIYGLDAVATGILNTIGEGAFIVEERV